MKFIWWFLAVAAVLGFSFNVGREYQKIKAKREADAAHKRLIEGLTEIARFCATVETAKPKPPDAPVPPNDTKANEPVTFKPGEADKALKAGKLALGRDHGGRDN